MIAGISPWWALVAWIALMAFLAGIVVGCLIAAAHEHRLEEERLMFDPRPPGGRAA